MGQEALSSVYDELWGEEDLNVPINKSFFYRLYRRVVAEVEKRGIDAVLEVGCGAGSLAELLLTRTKVQYRGFDFSPVGVRRAAQRIGRRDLFFVSDAKEPSSYQWPHTGIVCTEVLEHIAADLDVVSLWRPGTQCICSVPNFAYPTHVRHFRHEDEILARYGKLFDIDMIVRVPKPVFTGNTLREYLRKVRWAREQPKKMFGLLGINTFDWYSGWFLFAGTRTHDMARAQATSSKREPVGDAYEQN
jgi:2-polyprenyl-3-methyl-5-hydroxy-6-metoxy-1,4-benzoquinol methylase